MICSHPQCTGHHNRTEWASMCPQAKEDGLARERKRYAEMSWREHHAKQLKTRRIRAVQRLKARRLSGT